MALRLRRGTDAERLLITPQEGELLYITDTKELYAGDGTTVGGVRVTGEVAELTELGALTDVTLGSLENNDVLAYDSNTQQWGPVQMGAPELVESGDYRFNILSDDSSVVVDHVNSIHYGSFYGSVFSEGGDIIMDNVAGKIKTTTGEDFIDLTFQSIEGDFHGRVMGDDSTVIIDSPTGNINGSFVTASDKFVGNLTGNVLGDVNGELIGNVTGNVIGDVYGTHFGSVQGNVTGRLDGDVTGSVFADDSTIVVDGITGNLFGNLTGDVTGNVTGDLTGSVFGDDSTLIVDGINNIVTAESVDTDLISVPTDTLTVNSRLSGRTIVKVEAEENPGILNLVKTSTSDISGSSAALGRIAFTRDDTGGAQDTALIAGSNGYIAMSVDGTGAFSDPSTFLFWTGSALGVGKNNPAEALDVNGNALVSGFMQFGSLTTTDRNALTAANGMVIYNTTDNKFQGYENGSWVNLV